MMAEKGLSALLATDVINYTHLGGHRLEGLVPWRTRPFQLILPRDAEPMLIGQLMSKERIMATSWIKKVKTWGGLPFKIEVVVEALKEMGLTKGKIGCELGIEERLGISYNDFMQLKNSLPSVEFVDASYIFWKLRAVKTDAEIDCLRRACIATGKAFEELFSRVRGGTTLEEIRKTMLEYMMDGEIKPHFATVRIYPLASGSYLKHGDILWIDAGAACKGYRCDFSRMVAIGYATDKAKRMYKLDREITWNTMNLIKAGVKASDIAKACAAEMKRVGFSETKAVAVGRLGHGLGLGFGDPHDFFTELPSIGYSDDTVLEPNMVITIEPGETTDYGYFTLEENMVVTKDGYRVISPVSEEELRVV